MKRQGKIDHSRMVAALNGQLAPSELTEKENAARVKAFVELMGQPGTEERAFFSRRRRLGLGVGLDENGKLVYTEPLQRHEG